MMRKKVGLIIAVLILAICVFTIPVFNHNGKTGISLISLMMPGSDIWSTLDERYVQFAKNFDPEKIRSVSLHSNSKTVELTEKDEEKGYISYLTTDDESVAVAIVCADGEGMTLEDYMTYLANSEDISGVEYGLVNGIEAVSYDYEGNMNVAFMTDAGYLVEFTFGPMSDEGFATVASIMAASIQTIEE